MTAIPESEFRAMLDEMQDKHRFMVRALTHRYRRDRADDFIDDMRSRVDGLRQTLSHPRSLAALVGTREGILADELDHPVEQVGRDARHEVAHLGCLAALAGKQRGRGVRVGDEAHASAPWELRARVR